jgi:tetratricopeptide (TPR) repeat protein
MCCRFGRLGLIIKSKNMTGKTVEEYYAEGQELYYAEKYEAAIACFSKAIKLFGENELKIRWQPVDLYDKWKFDEAKASLEQSIELNCLNVQAYFWRGIAKIQAKDYHSAVYDLKWAVKFLPKLADTFDDKYTSQQWIDKGTEFYDKAQSFKNDNITLKSQGEGCLLLAKACFDKAMKNNRNFLRAYTDYLVERDLKDYTDALNEYEKLQQCPKCSSRNFTYCEADFVCNDCGFSKCE